MNRSIRITAVLLCVLCLMTLFPVSAAAQEFDPDEPLSLTVHYVDGETPVVGATFRLYKVAAMNSDLTYTADDTFKSYKDSIENPETQWDVLASTLKDYVATKKLKADDEAVTDADGKAQFPSGSKALTPGVYLLLSDRYRCEGKIYDPMPVIITLPNQDIYGDWVYDVDARAKFTPDDDTPIEIIVIKKWNDTGYTNHRPKSITVVLLRDGKQYKKKVLNKDNDWTWVWSDLDPIYTWEIKEMKVPGYNSTIEVDKVDNVWTVTITNDFDPENPPKLPQTGQLNWPIPVLLSSGAVLLCLGCFLRFGRRKDENV